MQPVESDGEDQRHAQHDTEAEPRVVDASVPRAAPVPLNVLGPWYWVPSPRELRLATFVLTLTPYDPEADVPGGVDAGGWTG